MHLPEPLPGSPLPQEPEQGPHGAHTHHCARLQTGSADGLPRARGQGPATLLLALPGDPTWVQSGCPRWHQAEIHLAKVDGVVEGREEHPPGDHHGTHQHVDGEEKEGDCIEHSPGVGGEKSLRLDPPPPAPSSGSGADLDEHSRRVFMDQPPFVEAACPVLGLPSPYGLCPTSMGDWWWYSLL